MAKASGHTEVSGRGKGRGEACSVFGKGSLSPGVVFAIGVVIVIIIVVLALLPM